MSFTAGSGALTVTAPPNGNIAPPGYYMLFVLNTSGVPSVAKFVQVSAGSPDFSLSVGPSSQVVAPGTGTSYTVSVTASNGFSGNVGFGVSGLPSGATASFTPSSVTGSGSSTMAVSTLTSTPTGSYPLTITATSGTLVHTTQATLVVVDFTISATPPSQTVQRGSQTNYGVTITPVGPFSATVNFSVTGLPRQTSASFNPKSVVGSGNSTLTVSAKKAAARGTYSLTITATGGGATHSQGVSLVIQ